MNNNTSIYFLISDSEQDNKKNHLSKLTEEHKKILNSNLLKNAFEQVNNFDQIKKYILTPEQHETIKNSNYAVIYYNKEKSVFEKIIEMQPEENEKYIFINSNVIGFSKDVIKRIKDLLLYDGEAIVIGKTIDNRICFIGTNFIDTTLLNHIVASNNNYDKLLSRIKRDNVFYFILNNFLKIETLKDFKELYSVLSDKKSENFCTGEIHESFTNLFIEYKELLQ